MKHLLTTAAVALSIAAAAWASPGEASRARRVATVTGDGTTIYGEVTHSNAMDVTTADGLAWGLYSFNASDPMTVTPLTIHNTLCANGGGTYRKGKLYFTSYYEDYTGTLGYLYFIEMDLSDYSIERHALTPDTYQSIAADMTYDPVGDKIYGVSFDPDDYNLTSYILVDYDITTGYPQTVAPIARMSAIASDNMGQLWGVRYSDGQLVKIDKSNGEVTEVGPTGVNPIYNGTACFDFETGKLYWASNERTTNKSALYEIDTTTGAAGMISLFPDGESWSALYIPRADDIANLSPVSGLTANFDGSSTEGSISFTAPSTTVDGTAISGDVTVTGYLDGALNFSIPLAPGATNARNYTLSQGQHSIEVIATHPTAGKSRRTRLDFYVGSDGPAAVTNLKAEKLSDTSIKLTWDTPAAGEHGGAINPALVYYKITRMPDGKVLSDEATGNSYTDNIPAGLMRRYSYEITGYYKNIAGATEVSGEVELGTPAALPYLQTFDTADDYATFVVVDNNRDDSRPHEGKWGWESEKQCAFYTYHTLLPGDDWLITPGLDLKKGQTYRLIFKSQGGRIYAETLEIKIGKGYKPADFTQTIMPRTDIKSPDQTMEERSLNFSVEEDGHYYIGFHAVTAKGQYWLWVDDIAVEEGPSMAAPGTVTELAATPGANETSVDISFKAPALDLFGNELESLESVKILRDGTEVKTLGAADGLAKGKEMKWTDTGVTTGKHTYSVICANGNGDGESSETEVFAGLDTPLAVTALSHTTADGTHAKLTWTAPEAGVNGGSLGYGPLTYTITDCNGKTVAEDLSETTFSYEVDTTKGQQSMFYNVKAINTAGASDAAASDFITYGTAFKDTFAESFAGGEKPTNSGWIMRVLTPSPYDNGFYGRYFGYSHKPNDKDRGPAPTAQDGDGGMLVAYTDFLDVEARMISPKINVSGLNNPVLSFWFYHYYNPDLENGFSTEKETMQVEALIDGEYKALTARPILLINGTGWYRYDLPLKEAVGAKDFQIAFRTHNYISYDMHVDNITVHDTPDNDLVISSFTLPANIAVNSTRNAAVTVFNNGMVPAEDFEVELLRDGETVSTLAPESALEFSKEMTISFPVTPKITEAGKSYDYSARVVFAADANPTDNVSETLTVTVPTNSLPRANNLRADVRNGSVMLTWDDPDMNAGGTVTDGFESYEPFTISNFGEWSLVDNDGSLTYTISNSASESGDYEYPNAGYQMAFQALNPGKAGIRGNLWTPYLGEQMAVCFAAAERSNDDWLISPEVKGGSKVSFMARSVVDSYGLDQFNFCYTTETGELQLSSFKAIGSTVTVPASEWTRYEFTLPADAVRFAINCVSDNTYALLVDDVTYESAHADMLEFRGYNVYLDGELLNDAIVEENAFTDANPKAEGAHVYNISVIYDKGESALSDDCLVDLSGAATLEADGMAVEVRRGGLAVLNAGGRQVTIASVNGTVVFNEEVGDYAFISLESGVYTLRAGDRALKVMIR